MIVVAKRMMREDRNDWNNYTNWILEDIPTWSDGFQNEFYERYYDEEESTEYVNNTNFNFRKSAFILENLDKIKIKWY